ncbi:MAG: hypothetical protein PF692_07805 [Kiritimatiellae bacterium]|jgi:hypothetical protein|nr:hypothetical protein [Kiritimatiellia bacterium]
MNLFNKLNELVSLLQRYLSGEVSIEALNEFVWEVIDFFDKSNSNDLPKQCEFEREFWYAVWQIQHLVGEEEKLVRKEITEMLGYLTNENTMPKEYEGRRP